MRPALQLRTVLFAGLLSALVIQVAAAEPPACTCPPLVVDGGLVFGLPAALPTGLSTGVGAGVTQGGWLAWGARASWSSATEYTSDWSVNHDDVRLRVLGILQSVQGRGSFALRLGLGGTLVHETRTRDQGSRAGLTGSDLATTAWSMLPAADLEAAVSLRVSGAWSLVVSGGPSFDVLSGALHTGWIGGLGVAWRR